jgi:DNA-binding MarR family transcriptional regulator/ribosomal protein S18 acetylase RimI-like enzyme
MAGTATQRVRSFNRTVTQRIGVLQDEYLARGRPLGASRVLWEVGEGPVDIRALRARLDLDSGYLSRLLRAIEAEGLVAVEPGAGDRRVRTVRLTGAGRAERAVLDRESDALANSLLAPLGPAQRERLVDAMAVVERLLTAGLVEVAVEDPRSAAAASCLRAYAEEMDATFEGGFDPARSRAVDPAALTPPAGLLLVARLHGEPVACGALRLPPAEPAEIKRLWVAPGARGLGVGRRVLAELEAHARRAGAGVVHLDTNRALRAATQLYRSSGYVEVAPFNDEAYADHWFEKRLSAAGDPAGARGPSAPSA